MHVKAQVGKNQTADGFSAVKQTGPIQGDRSQHSEKCISHLRATPPRPPSVRHVEGLPADCPDLIQQFKPRSRAQPGQEQALTPRLAVDPLAENTQGPARAAQKPSKEAYTTRRDSEVDIDWTSLNEQFNFLQRPASKIVCLDMSLQEIYDRQKEDAGQAGSGLTHRTDRRWEQRGTGEKMQKVVGLNVKTRALEAHYRALENYIADQSKVGELFHKMLSSMPIPETFEEKSTRYMLVGTNVHCMAVRLRVKLDSQGRARYVINWHDPNATFADRRFTGSLEDVKNLNIESFLPDPSLIDDYFEPGPDRILGFSVVPNEFHSKPLSQPLDVGSAENRTLELFLTEQQTARPAKSLAFYLASHGLHNQLKTELDKCKPEQALETLTAKNSAGTPLLYMALHLGHTDTIKAIVDYVASAKEKGWITDEQVLEVLSAKFEDGKPGLYKALFHGGESSIKAFTDLVTYAKEKGCIGQEQALDLLPAGGCYGLWEMFSKLRNSADEKNPGEEVFTCCSRPGAQLSEMLRLYHYDGTPVLFVMLLNNKAERIKEFVDFLKFARSKEWIGNSELYDLLAARSPSGRPGLAMAFRNGNADAIKVFGDVVNFAKDKGWFTIEQVCELLAAKDTDGTPGLHAAVKNNHADAIKVFGDVVFGTPEGLVGAFSRLVLFGQDDGRIKGWRLGELLAAKDTDETPALHAALKNDHVDAIETYIDLLFEARQKERISGDLLVRLLAAKGADDMPGILFGDAEGIECYGKCIMAALQDDWIQSGQVCELLAGKYDGHRPWLHAAVKDGNAEAVSTIGKIILDAKRTGKINSKQLWDLLQAKDAQGTPVLQMAMENESGRAEAIEVYEQLLSEAKTEPWID